MINYRRPWISGDDEDSDRYLIGPEEYPGLVIDPIIKTHCESDAGHLVAEWNALLTENASLRERLEKAEKDAERYQFLRFADLDALADDNWRDSEVWTGDKFDAAIDAAIKAQKEGKS